MTFRFAPSLRFSFVLLLGAALSTRAAIDAPVTPNAQPGVAQLLNFLADINGRYILSGQQEIAWDLNRQEEDIDYIRSKTGKTPVVRGFDFLQYVYSPSVRAHQNATERAIAWARGGGIVTFCCHMFMNTGSAPGAPQFYVPAANHGVGTTFDIRQAVIAGTPENTEFLQKLDIVAAELKKLRDAGVVVIWRPFHECSGGWFWWGAQGPAPLKQAWRLMFDRFTQMHGLNNLIWEFNPTDTLANNLPAWYPGDDVVDMISADFYPTAGTHPDNAANYKALRDFKAGHKIVAMSENGALPDIDAAFTNGANWAYFCTWNGFENDVSQNSVAFLNTVFNHPKVLTLDELPALYVPFSIVVATPPRSQRLTVGDPLSLTVGLDPASSGPVTYQWLKDGAPLAGATSATYAAPNVGSSAAGAYSVRIAGSAGSVTSAPADIVVVPAGTASSRLVNISTRALGGTGDNVTIGGFVVSGSASKKLLLRAVGPTLAELGIAANAVMPNPTIELHDAIHGNATIATIDNWNDVGDGAQITAAASNLGAYRLAGGDATSAATVRTLPAGVYSFIARDVDPNATGVVLVEAYDADDASSASSIVNISTRAYCSTGDNVAIGGFVITGSAPKRVLLRALGPTLSSLGIGSDKVLSDPTIELHDASHGNTTIATNENWQTSPYAAEMVTTGARVGATPILNTDDASAALLLFLNPGAYSFIVRGKNETSGIVLIEVYDSD